MWRVFFTSAVVAVVVRSAMNWCKSGKCGHFGSGGFIIWDISGLVFRLIIHRHFLFIMLDQLILNYDKCLLKVVKKTTLFRNFFLWLLLGLLVVF